MSHKTLAGAVQSKFWGQTQGIFVGPKSEVHYLEIEKGGYCSEHCHEYKWNRFFVIEGELDVIVYRLNGEDITTLRAGQFTDVSPGVYHKFDCKKDTKCLEVYWIDETNLDPCDIKRKNFGGKKPSEIGLKS